MDSLCENHKQAGDGESLVVVLGCRFIHKKSDDARKI